MAILVFQGQEAINHSNDNYRACPTQCVRHLNQLDQKIHQKVVMPRVFLSSKDLSYQKVASEEVHMSGTVSEQKKSF